MEARPGRDEVRSGARGRLEGVSNGHSYPDGSSGGGECLHRRRRSSKSSSSFEVFLIFKVVRAILGGRVVRVVVDGVRGGEEVGEVDASEVRAEEAEWWGGRRPGVAVEEGEDDGRARETGRPADRGRARRWETRAAMSRAMEVLPDEGYPAMRVSLPRGMRLGQSQSGGCWMRKSSGWSPASNAPAAV